MARDKDHPRPEGVQGYLDQINEAARVARERAAAAARTLLAQTGLEEAADEATERLGRIADDIANATRDNRETLERVIASEVERVATRVGFARSDELADLRAEVDLLRARVEVQTAAAEAAPRPRRSPASPATKSPATKTAAKQAAPKSSTKKATAKQAAAQQAPLKKSTAKKAAQRKSAAAKDAAKKAPGVRAAGRKSAAAKAAESAAAGPSGPEL